MVDQIFLDEIDFGVPTYKSILDGPSFQDFIMDQSNNLQWIFTPREIFERIAMQVDIHC